MKRQTHGKFLRHAHQRVVDRQIAVRMIFAHGFAGDAGGFVVAALRRKVLFAHGEEDAPMDGLQPVAHIRQGAAHDHAHGVIEVASLHLVGDGDRADVALPASMRRVVVVFGQDRASLRAKDERQIPQKKGAN